MGTPCPRHQRPTRLRKFLFGAPYYPEHWSAQDRQDDARRMADAGVNVVRMGEFAWDRVEPARGRFDFRLFDETIGRLGEAGVSTIFCTPTATPPRWLTHGHDDWMRVDASGRAMGHGSRQHVCTNNEAFRAESRRITAALAEHFAPNPHVIGWQTDNELHCHFSECCCPACEAGFRAWLADRYGSIKALNAAWGTAFWALTFDGFEQVPLPHADNRPAYPNPTHELDYYRYLSDSVIEFQAQQVRIIRQANANWWVTHNGLFGHIDHWRFAEDLDFLGVDVYPGFGATGKPLSAAWPACVNERCRAASGGYIIPEQQGGPGGQRPYIHRTPQPGQMRLWAWQGVAHGADGVLHFRWRTCRFGAEEYWHGILDHDNVPRRRYEEFAFEGRELQRVGGRVLGTVLDVQAAVLVETEQDEAHRTMNLGLPSPGRQADLAYREMWLGHLPCGLVQTADSFDGLAMLVLPSMPLMDSVLADKLWAFVAGGGTLLVTARSAIRDRNNQAVAQTPLGLLAELCGVAVEEFGREEPGPSLHMMFGDRQVPHGGGYEVLDLHGAGPLATWRASAEYGPSAAAGRPAISENRVGKGRVVYAGTYLSEENASAVLGLAVARAGVEPLAQCAEGVEVTRRRAAGRGLTFVLNHHPAPRTVRGLPAGTELLTEIPCDGEIELAPYGVAVIEER